MLGGKNVRRNVPAALLDTTGMTVAETIARIRRGFFVKRRLTKQILWALAATM